MRAFLLCLLCLITSPAAAFLHSTNSANITASQLATAYGGLVMDFTKNDFHYTPAGGGTRVDYADFPAMFTALSGTYTGSGKNCFNSAGILVNFTTNTPAQPCFKGDSSLQGWLTEQATTQLLTNPELYTGSEWNKTGVSLASQTLISIRGDQTASVITEDGSTGNHWISQTKTKATSILGYTANCYFQPGTGNRNFAIQVDDNAGNGVVVSVPNDQSESPASKTFGAGFLTINYWWDQAGTIQNGLGVPFYRLSVALDSNTATSIRVSCGLADGLNTSYQGNSTSSAVVFGANLTQGTVGAVQTAVVPTSYISTAATRALDVASFNLPVAMQSQAAYSGYAGISLPKGPNGLAQTYFALESADGTNNIAINQTGPATNGVVSMRVVSNTKTGSLSLPGPNNAYNQDALFGFIAANASYTIDSSLQAKRTSANLTFPEKPITKVQIASYSSGATVTGNYGLATLAIFPAKVPASLLHNLLVKGPQFNPDVITPPNYFTYATIGSVLPSYLKVWRSGPPPPAAQTPSTNYALFPVSVAYSQDPATSGAGTSVPVSATSYDSPSGNLTITTTTPLPVTVGQVFQLKGFAPSVYNTKFTAQNGTLDNTIVGKPLAAFSGSPASVTNYGVANAADPNTTFANLSWGNRADALAGSPNPKPNSYGIGISLSPEYKGYMSFSSYDKADGATLATDLWYMGYPAHATGACPTGQDYCGWLDAAAGKGGYIASDVIQNHDALPGSQVPVTGVTYSSPNVTVTTSKAHSVVPGQKFFLTGMTPAVYNTVYLATAGTTGNVIVGAPVVSFGTPAAPTYFGYAGSYQATLTAISFQSSPQQITATTDANHGISPGETFVLTGMITNAATPFNVGDDPLQGIYNTAYQAVAGTSGTTLIGTPLDPNKFPTNPVTRVPGTVLTYGTAVRSPVFTNFEPYNLASLVTKDKIIFPAVDIRDGVGPKYGIFEDSEMADLRTADRTTYMTKQKALIVHNSPVGAGYKFAVVVDTLYGTGAYAGYCGPGAPPLANCNTMDTEATFTGSASTDPVSGTVIMDVSAVSSGQIAPNYLISGISGATVISQKTGTTYKDGTYLLDPNINLSGSSLTASNGTTFAGTVTTSNTTGIVLLNVSSLVGTGTIQVGSTINGTGGATVLQQNSGQPGRVGVYQLLPAISVPSTAMTTFCYCNMRSILASVDLLSLPYSSGVPKGYTFATNLQNQWNYLGAPDSFDTTHVMPQFDLGQWPGGTTPQNADDFRAFLLSKGSTNILIAPLNSAPGGGQCRYTNIKIAKLLGLDTTGC